MSTIDMEFTRKIQFAEEWLRKAREKFEQGSSVEAGSNIILAIAEMETLKRAFFSESEPKPQIKLVPKRTQIRFDLRPIYALLLLFFALSLFLLTMHRIKVQPVDESPLLASNSSSINHGIAMRNTGFDYAKPDFEHLLTVNIPDPDTIPDLTPEPASIASISNDQTPLSTSKSGSGTTRKAFKNPASKRSVVKPANTENIKITPVSDSVIREEINLLVPADIQLETIYAALESLNEE